MRLTEAAMNGDIALDAVYGRRLEIIRPSLSEVEKLAVKYKTSLVPDAADVVKTLTAAGAIVHLVTAGIEQAIVPLAPLLGIQRSRVHAVRLDFDSDGAYAGYDRRSFLTRPGGKAVVIRDIRARNHGKAVLIGDGVTDAEAAGTVDLFVGFGGVTMRPAVRDRSAVYISELSLSALLPLILEESDDDA